jgi:ABC-2 type transport system ATP-binding protein
MVRTVQELALEVRGLTKRFGSLIAVDDLSFEVPSGTVCGFLGPNGAGKTTTMRVLLGLASATEGSVRIQGRPYRDLDQPLRRVGAALEVTGFHPGRTARNHLRMSAMQGGLPAARIDTCLEQVAMADFADQRVGGFSSGMRQRLSLATALLGDPDVLVLDEPANGLDPAGVVWLRGFLRSFASAGRTVLVSSHVLEEVAKTADRLVVIDHGKLVADGPVDRILGADGETVVVRSPELERLERKLTEAGGSVSNADGALHVTGLPIERVGDLAAAAGIVLHELRKQVSTLEEAFLALTEEGSP